jgi:hypothetical protein
MLGRMSPLDLALLPFAAGDRWEALARRRPAFARVFAAVVLPLALVPPLMLYVAGTRRPGMFPPALDDARWGALAATVFAVEIGTMLAMAWLVLQVARSSRLALDGRAALLVAALAPAPLWLSALGLVVPDLRVATALAGLALAATCRALFHGVARLGRAREPVVAAWVVQVAIGGALLPWIVLVAAVLA